MSTDEIKRFITDKFKCVDKLFHVNKIYKLGEKKIYYVTTTPQINLRVSPSFIMYIDDSIDSDTPTKTILPQCSTGGWAGSRLR